MDLATIIIITGTVVGGAFFIMDKYFHNNALATKGHLLNKFKEVKAEGISLYDDLHNHSLQLNEDLLSVYDCNECLETLREKIDIEYSDAEYLKLKTIRLTKNNIMEYSERFKCHQDVLISLRQDYNIFLLKITAVKNAV
jgi:hypothetical protein